MSKHSLQNLDNYKTDFTHNITEIYSKYLGIMKEYIIQFVDTIYISNITYYKYILKRGVETLSNVFKMILLYTKNLNITYNLCQKSLYYFVEFICQIGDDSHSFLQLNSKDASLFVYKKTIFELNNEHRKEFGSVKESCVYMDSLDIIIELHNTFLFYNIEDYSFTKSKDSNLIKTIESGMIKFQQGILNLSLKISNECYYKKLLLIRDVYEIMSIKNSTVIPYIVCLLKKYQKKNINISNIKKNLLNRENNNNLENYTTTKYINWLINDNNK